MSESAVGQYFLNRRPEIAPLLPASVRASLEIGCGAGGFSRTFLDLAGERWGIEPNRSAAAAGDHVFSRLLVGTYDEVESSLPDHHFDLVICNDVIEHMPSHDRFLQQIKQKMTPGAIMVGSIPNIRHFTALLKLLLLKDWPYANDGILDRTHLRFFTERSLRRAFVENGYEIEHLQGIRSIIREGVTGLPPAKKLVSRIATATAVAASLGYWSDIQYPQFAFRVRPLDA